MLTTLAPDIARHVAAVLDLRLSAASGPPVALALSGGGDSVALLRATQAWAEARGRRLVVLTVDHQLQPQSAAWTAACAAQARAAGAAFRALVWTGEKPRAGLPAAARAARHRLLAEAARAAGCAVLLIGHTADDVAEARAMRAAGSTTPEPREWSPSPAWPEGRRLFLLRPLLRLRRADLRRWLEAQDARWIEDPANLDRRYARARARADLPASEPIALAADAAPSALAQLCRLEPWGGISLARAALRAEPAEEVERWLGLAAVCAGGGDRLPAGAARARLAERLRGAGPVAASLAGARIEAADESVRITREAGEALRGGLRPLALAPGVPAVWDGRFELCAAAEGLTVLPLQGLARRLPAEQQRALARLPAAARPALPAIVDGDGGVSSPLLGASGAAIADLVGERLAAAAGLVTREPD